MNVQRCIKESFAVIGKEGSTQDGPGFVQRLWASANAGFPEVAGLAKRDEKGNPAGIWGAMTDCSGNFRPWEKDFSEGKYLAGVEVAPDTPAPEGWTKWVIPCFEYLYVECETETVFTDMLRYMQENGISLAGAVQDFTCPQTGKNYMFFPIRKL